MKLNGKTINTFNSLRNLGNFDFPAFWEKREEFLKLSCRNGKVWESFWDQPDLLLGQVVCDWLNPDVAPHEFKCFVESGNLCRWTGESFARQKQTLAGLGNACEKTYAQLHEVLDQKSAVGLVALYKLLGKTPNVNLCLSVIKGEGMNELGDVLYCRKDVSFGDASPDADAPLQGKIIVNASDKDIRVMGQLTLHPGECVPGVFQGNQCIELLPREGSNNRKQLALSFDLQRGISLLQVTDAVTRQSTMVENVLSFYLDGHGYAYVTRDGRVVVPEDEKWQVYGLYSYLRKTSNERVIAVKSSKTPGGNEEYKMIYASTPETKDEDKRQ